MARKKHIRSNILKDYILDAAVRIVSGHGLNALTARNVAATIGYAPSTIYNSYRDMGALITEVNYTTLGELERLCKERVTGLPDDIAKLRALAYAYVDFANKNEHAWAALFAGTRRNAKLPAAYRKRVVDLFTFIEETLRACIGISEPEAHKTARLLWSSLHGITALMLDGRLKLIGIDDPRDIIDDLLLKQFAPFKKENMT